jgi:hypothetical protein
MARRLPMARRLTVPLLTATATLPPGTLAGVGHHPLSTSTSPMLLQLPSTAQLPLIPHPLKVRTQTHAPATSAAATAASAAVIASAAVTAANAAATAVTLLLNADGAGAAAARLLLLLIQSLRSRLVRKPQQQRHVLKLIST